VPWYTIECHGMQPSATNSIIVICAIAYINIVFLQYINTMFMYNTTMLSSWQVSELPPMFVMPSSWQVCNIGTSFGLSSALVYSRVPWNAAECHQVYNCHLCYCIYQHCFSIGYKYYAHVQHSNAVVLARF
jgi:hypothetical protein